MATKQSPSQNKKIPQRVVKGDRPVNWKEKDKQNLEISTKRVEEKEKKVEEIDKLFRGQIVGRLKRLEGEAKLREEENRELRSEVYSLKKQNDGSKSVPNSIKLLESGSLRSRDKQRLRKLIGGGVKHKSVDGRTVEECDGTDTSLASSAGGEVLKHDLRRVMGELLQEEEEREEWDAVDAEELINGLYRKIRKEGLPPCLVGKEEGVSMVNIPPDETDGIVARPSRESAQSSKTSKSRAGKKKERAIDLAKAAKTRRTVAAKVPVVTKGPIGVRGDTRGNDPTTTSLSGACGHGVLEQEVNIVDSCGDHALCEGVARKPHIGMDQEDIEEESDDGRVATFGTLLGAIDEPGASDQERKELAEQLLTDAKPGRGGENIEWRPPYFKKGPVCSCGNTHSQNLVPTDERGFCILSALRNSQLSDATLWAWARHAFEYALTNPNDYASFRQTGGMSWVTPVSGQARTDARDRSAAVLAGMRLGTLEEKYFLDVLDLSFIASLNQWTLAVGLGGELVSIELHIHTENGCNNPTNLPTGFMATNRVRIDVYYVALGRHYFGIDVTKQWKDQEGVHSSTALLKEYRAASKQEKLAAEVATDLRLRNLSNPFRTALGDTTSHQALMKAAREATLTRTDDSAMALLIVKSVAVVVPHVSLLELEETTTVSGQVDACGLHVDAYSTFVTIIKKVCQEFCKPLGQTAMDRVWCVFLCLIGSGAFAWLQNPQYGTIRTEAIMSRIVNVLAALLSPRAFLKREDLAKNMLGLIMNSFAVALVRNVPEVYMIQVCIHLFGQWCRSRARSADVEKYVSGSDSEVYNVPILLTTIMRKRAVWVNQVATGLGLGFVILLLMPRAWSRRAAP
jgi:hypothetical protein